MNKQSGFTLVEIAIVLVIIGLLLGGVLKGQEIITNARIKNLENDFNGLSAAIYSYQDRYRRLPGDDTGATRFNTVFTSSGGSGTAPVGDGDGTIAGKFNSTTDTDESRKFWVHLRSAGLVAGKASDFANPLNAFSGITGVATNAKTNGASQGDMPGLFVGFTQIPNEIGQILESRVDDGSSKAGTVQADQADYNVETTLYQLYLAL